MLKWENYLEFLVNEEAEANKSDEWISLAKREDLEKYLRTYHSGTETRKKIMAALSRLKNSDESLKDAEKKKVVDKTNISKIKDAKGEDPKHFLYTNRDVNQNKNQDKNKK